MITNTKKILVNFSVFMYFLLLLLTSLFENYIIFIFFYLSLLLCGIVGLYVQNLKLTIQKFLVIGLFVFMGIMNIFIVGNTTINEIIFVLLFGIVSFTISSKELNEKTLLLILGLNIIVVLYKYLTVGLYGRLYTSASRNFVSVYLMYPTVIYYSIIARKKNEYINMLPVILVWILSLISRGRGGIISSTVFLIGVYIVKYRSMKLIKKMIVISIFFLAIAIAMLNISYILEKLRTSVIMELFVSNGMNSSRTRFWSEYIELAVSNLKNFVFGANISDTFIGRYLEGNPHNSFIEIHILNGIFSLITIIVLLIKNGITSFREKNYLYFVCMLSIMIRAFTDHVLWASFGTPILFYFIFYYNVIIQPCHNNYTYIGGGK